MFNRIASKLKFVRSLAAFTAAAFLLVGLVSLDMGGMANVEVACSMASTASHEAHGGAPRICPMQVGEHLAWWQSTFTGIPGSSSILGMLALFAAILVATLIFAPFDIKSLLYVRFVHGSKDPPDDNLHDYFALFLAAGKAQPLLYA